MKVFNARYFDGERSVPHEVSVMIAGGKLKLVGREVDREFDARGVRRSLRIANTPRWLYLPGGGACVTEDNDAVDRLLRDRGYERVLHKWESRPAYAALAVVLVVFTAWLLVYRLLPLAVEEIAGRIPVEAEAVLGRETLEGMDRFVLQPSTLPAARQARLRARLAAMMQEARDATPYRVEFRASRSIGPNAFALPSGIIVVTDELVRLARRDEEVLAVLAHELGHVRYRHTMRRLLEGSATALVVAGLTGDVASTTSLAAAAPALLLQTKFSRDNEREADQYAIELMRKAKLNPGYLGAILSRMESGSKRGGGMPTFLSSHPATAEREALARARSDAALESEAVEADAAPERRRRKLLAVDEVQRRVVALVASRDYGELERVLGAYQAQFEQDSSATAPLENAFRAFRKLPPGAESALNEWVDKTPGSYPARLGRGIFYLWEGLEVRGARFAADTPKEDMAAMQALHAKARSDLEGSLGMAQKPYLSRLSLVTLARYGGGGATARAHYDEAAKLAPQSVELRLAYMTALEPRWGGSYAKMEEFVGEATRQLNDPAAANRLAARITAYSANERRRADDRAEALRLYDEAVALDANGSILCERSFVLSEMERHAEAFADVKLALAKVRDDRYCLDRATRAASQVKPATEVIELMSLVLEADPGSSAALNRRGWVYEQLGQQAQALQDFSASARLGDAWAIQHLKKIQPSASKS